MRPPFVFRAGNIPAKSKIFDFDFKRCENNTPTSLSFQGAACGVLPRSNITSTLGSF